MASAKGNVAARQLFRRGSALQGAHAVTGSVYASPSVMHRVCHTYCPVSLPGDAFSRPS